MRHGRGLGQIACDALHPAGLDLLDECDEAVDVHGFVQAVVNRLMHERMIGNHAVAGDVFEARKLVGKHGGEQVFGFHALQRRGDLASAAVAREGEGATRIPPPPDREHRRIEQRLDEDLAHGVAVQIAENLAERKRMLGAEGKHDGIVGGGGLQFEIEGAAEPLAKREAPRPVDAAAERGMDDQLHPARFVEEAFQDELLAGGDDTERLVGRGEIAGEL